MKKTSIAIGSLVITSLLVAGCFGKKTDTAGQDEFAIPACNEYVKLMKCVAEKANGGADSLAAVDQAIAAWKTLSEDQLTQTCNMAIAAVAENASAYTQLGCEIPASAAAVVVTGDVAEDSLTGATTTGEDTLTGEDASVVESVANEVVSGTTAQ